jgi:hypothetical protein
MAALHRFSSAVRVRLITFLNQQKNNETLY